MLQKVESTKITKSGNYYWLYLLKTETINTLTIITIIY